MTRANDGQIVLATGERIAMRMWRDEAPNDAKPPSTRDYETVGYVLSGRARLRLAEKTIDLAPGDSWVVPSGASHTYEILETFSAIEATSRPA